MTIRGLRWVTVAALVAAGALAWAKPAKVDEVLKRVEMANAKFTNLSAEIKYTRAIPLLDEEQVCKGELRYIKPGFMLLKIGPPRKEDVYTDGKSWWVVNHQGKQVEHYRVTDDRKTSQEASFLQFGFRGNVAELKKGYKVSLAGEKKKDEETLWVLKLIPKLKQGPSRFSRIDITVSSKTGLPRKITLMESDGEIEHHFEFVSTKLDPGLKPKDLSFELPRGYALIQPEAGG
jgi:outer membrane lipoprotein-sorting protein